MKLNELFPEKPIVKFRGKEYELKFSTRSLLELEKHYPTPQEISAVVRSSMTGMRATDVLRLLHAGLLHTKEFTSFELLVDEVEPGDINSFVDPVVSAYLRSKMTDEQIRKLQVIGDMNGSKKKPDASTGEASTPSAESDAK